jgi:hypothetical protein
MSFFCTKKARFQQAGKDKRIYGLIERAHRRFGGVGIVAIFFDDAVEGSLCSLQAFLAGGKAIDVVYFVVGYAVDVPFLEQTFAPDGFRIADTAFHFFPEFMYVVIHDEDIEFFSEQGCYGKTCYPGEESMFEVVLFTDEQGYEKAYYDINGQHDERLI